MKLSLNKLCNQRRKPFSYFCSQDLFKVELNYSWPINYGYLLPTPV